MMIDVVVRDVDDIKMLCSLCKVMIMYEVMISHVKYFGCPHIIFSNASLLTQYYLLSSTSSIISITKPSGSNTGCVECPCPEVVGVISAVSYECVAFIDEFRWGVKDFEAFMIGHD